MHSARRYLERHGKPVAFYSDKHSVFRVNKKEALGGTGMTQFGRARNDLNIDIIVTTQPTEPVAPLDRALRTG